MTNKLLFLLFLALVIPVGGWGNTLTVRSTANDGNVTNSGAVWATVRNATTGNGINNTAASLPVQARFAPSTYTIDRIFLTFNTSALGADATITGVNLTITGVAGGFSANVSVQQGTHSDTLTTADFDSFTGSLYAWKQISPNNSPTIIDLTTSASINKTGVTKFCLREYNYDYLDSSTLAGNISTFYMSEQGGTFFDPNLTIIYTTPGGVDDSQPMIISKANYKLNGEAVN